MAALTVNKGSVDAPRPQVTRDTRIPMTGGRLSLQCDQRPGYHRHWMRGTPDRLAQALAAGYTFVESDSANLMDSSLGSSGDHTQGTDLGSRISKAAGSGMGPNGQYLRLYLMEMPEEFHKDDMKFQDDQQRKMRGAMRSGTMSPGEGLDNSRTYVKQYKEE